MLALNEKHEKAYYQLSTYWCILFKFLNKYVYTYLNNVIKCHIQIGEHSLTPCSTQGRDTHLFVYHLQIIYPQCDFN